MYHHLIEVSEFFLIFFVGGVEGMYGSLGTRTLFSVGVLSFSFLCFSHGNGNAFSLSILCIFSHKNNTQSIFSARIAKTVEISGEYIPV